MWMKKLVCLSFILVLAGCASPPPRDLNNICSIFNQYPHWYREAKDVERRWRVPVAVQMAIIHQESKFDAHAKPGNRKILWFIPWSRPSTAYGYSQALNGTWRHYQLSSGGFFRSRESFKDGVDFIGWYANMAARKAGIPRNHAYALYLAYHEGVGGYLNKTYLRKTWLMLVARKVEARARIYQAQLNHCRRRFN
ncbi:MAG: hypothetical protein ACOYKA_00030 [Legionellaceae bacterium]